VSQPLGDDRLAAYLLGRLSPEQEDTVEIEYLGAADACDRLEAAEDELIDAYVAGRLAADDVPRFEERFLASPARRERVAFARALRTLVAQKAERPATRRSWLLLPAAAVVPVALAAGWSLLTVRDLRIEVTRQHEQQAARERESAEDHARIASLEQELTRSRPTAAIVTWRLAPGFERDATTPARLTVPADAGGVRLQLSLATDATGPYVARVETAEGRVVAELHGLHARESGGPVVEVVVPAASLPPGTYVVIVRAGQPLEVVDTYRLRVAAP
jgi:hypothetical protein